MKHRGHSRRALTEPDAAENSYGFMCWQGVAQAMSFAHTHHDIEMNLLMSGAFSYLFGGTYVEVKAGELAVFWASVPHQLVRFEPDTQFSWLTLPLSDVLGWPLPNGFIQSILNGEFIIEVANKERHKGHFDDWESDFASGDSVHKQIAALEIEACLRRVALNYPGKVSRNSLATPGEIGHIEKMTAFMAQNYALALRIDDIAGAAHLHPNYAMTLFKRTFGISLGEFLTRTRLTHAQRRLATTDDTVLNIAFSCGFGSASQFHAAFKKYCGQSPSAFRKSV